MKDKCALLLTGGRMDKELVSHYFHLLNHEFQVIVIAVDKGLMTADALRIPIDYLVGDFDSLSPELLDKYMDKKKQEEEFQILEFNPVKDATDTQIAIELAIKLKVKEMVILGATGTRMDHALGNIHLLLLPLKEKIKAFIIDTYNKIYLIDQNTTLSKSELYGEFLSLLPFTDVVEGITLIGFKYPLTNKTYFTGDSLGISNEVIEKQSDILLKSGILIVIESKD